MSDRLEIAKTICEIFAILLAGAWSIWLFIYQDQVLPSRVTTQLTMDTELTSVGRFQNFKVVQTDVRIKNAGEVRAYIVGSIFNVRAYSIKARSTPVIPGENLSWIRRKQGDFMDLPQWLDRGEGQIVNSGRLLPASGAWIDANEERVVSFVSFVPDKHQLLSVRSEIRHSKDRGEGMVLVDYPVGRDGFTWLDVRVANRGRTEPYKHVEHHEFLGDSDPYRVYSVAFTLLSDANELQDRGAVPFRGSLHNPAMHRTAGLAPTRR